MVETLWGSYITVAIPGFVAVVVGTDLLKTDAWNRESLCASNSGRCQSSSDPLLLSTSEGQGGFSCSRIKKSKNLFRELKKLNTDSGSFDCCCLFVYLC